MCRNALNYVSDAKFMPGGLTYSCEFMSSVYWAVLKKGLLRTQTKSGGENGNQTTAAPEEKIRNWSDVRCTDVYEEKSENGNGGSTKNTVKSVGEVFKAFGNCCRPSIESTRCFGEWTPATTTPPGFWENWAARTPKTDPDNNICEQPGSFQPKAELAFNLAADALNNNMTCAAAADHIFAGLPSSRTGWADADCGDSWYNPLSPADKGWPTTLGAVLAYQNVHSGLAACCGEGLAKKDVPGPELGSKVKCMAVEGATDCE